MYDFYGFPKELYEIKYPAKGSSEFASKAEEKLINKGIKINKDLTRGLDHGAWTLLQHLFPKANIPIVQVFINSDLLIQKQIEIGDALKGLGDEDILIIGSGNTVHNLSLVDFEAVNSDSWAEEFDDWLINRLKENNILSPHIITKTYLTLKILKNSIYRFYTIFSINSVPWSILLN